MRIIFSFFFLLTFFSGYGQKILKGKVVEELTDIPIEYVFVVNKSTLKSYTTDALGLFQIEVNTGDSLVFSNISWQFLFYVVPETYPDTVLIKLKERNYLLEEVNVSSFKLTTNDPEPMKLEEPLVPKSEDIQDPILIEPGISSPVDFLYYHFGNKPKQMQELRELQKKDEFKRKLAKGFNREIIIRVTGLNQEELNQFLLFCRYSEAQISLLNDYEYINSLLSCYNNYLKNKEIDDILKEQDDGWR